MAISASTLNLVNRSLHCSTALLCHALASQSRHPNQITFALLRRVTRTCSSETQRQIGQRLLLVSLEVTSRNFCIEYGSALLLNNNLTLWENLASSPKVSHS